MPLPEWGKNLGVVLCAAVILAASFLFLFRLGEKPFWDYDEAIYANILQDSLKSGDIVTLKMGTEPWFEKPPLSFWLGIGVDRIFQNPEFSYRLSAALSGILSIALVILITYEVTENLFIAALAGLILLTTGPYLQAGREFRLDVPAIAMTLATVYAYLRGVRAPVWFLGIGIGLALGFLFKSVIGLLSLPCIVLWSLYSRNFTWLKSMYVWIGGLVCIAILLPWYAYEAIHFGPVFWQSSIFENLSRIGANAIGSSVSAKEYLQFFFLYAAPWSVAFTAALLWLGSNFKQYADARMRPVFVFASTSVFLFLLFLLSSTKIFDYLLPIYPFMAITVALSIGYAAERLKNNTSMFRVGACALSILILGAIWVSVSFGFHLFSYVAVNDLIVGEEKAAAKIIAQHPQNLDLYSYQYNYYDTIEYYSGRRQIKGMTDDQLLDQPFLLVVSKPYMDWHSFPPELQAHLETLYMGQTLILYKFTP